jgi:5-methylcytosine-specific restriction enzyme A
MVHRDDALRRGDSTQRLYGYAWAQARKLYLLHNPKCINYEQCRAAARVVDHDPPHRGDHDAFWDVRTWQPMCKACHDRKTVLQDGGFGRPRKDHDKETT